MIKQSLYTIAYVVLLIRWNTRTGNALMLTPPHRLKKRTTHPRLRFSCPITVAPKTAYRTVNFASICPNKHEHQHQPELFLPPIEEKVVSLESKETPGNNWLQMLNSILGISVFFMLLLLLLADDTMVILPSPPENQEVLDDPSITWSMDASAGFFFF